MGRFNKKCKRNGSKISGIALEYLLLNEARFIKNFHFISSQVIEMTAPNFFSCEELLKQFCTNRKKTVDKNDLNWLTFRKICYKKDRPLELFFETYNDVSMKYNADIEFKPDLMKTVSIRKKGMKNEDFVAAKLPLLYPDGKAIATAKKMDLVELLEFISVKNRKFYTSLKHSDEDQDCEPCDETIFISDDESAEN